MKHKIVNDEQFEFWNEGIGRKWVEEDDSMNERLSILTKELFLRSNIKRDDKILDIGCGGGQTTFEASEILSSPLNLMKRIQF
jgi:ubiquinone/menaquinone biosynthesis C-methylase UbiE